jgi:serine/threonine protein kinase
MSEPQHDVKAIFLAAVAKATPAERSAYLDEACAGDAVMRKRVDALLQAYDAPGEFFGQPAVGAVPTSDEVLGRFINPDELHGADTTGNGVIVGTWIGPYKLLQLLGEGGMGAVYMAEQEEPVKRRVALKIIKTGLDSERVIARFEAERQALAMMDHPNIAKVLDAGTTDARCPYFVMELVKGIPITKYCDQEHLTPRERLDLFIPVCQAVQHAHQKGIIHRDIKPSNVLIALYDGKPIPKVIDFGVAKATAQKLTERTMFTEVGQIVGTLEYMAPEQAELNNLDIDTRADIYSLGVLLYELLTGSPPFTSKQLRTAAFDEMLRIIREVEPQKPSTKLSSSEELPSIAANRKLEPAKLARLVRGDLDWIVMKCLEKERARRYETANGLAMDVQRYLADEPVLASPPSAAYRLRKFVRKNRGPVLAAAIVAIVLMGGIIGTSLGFLRAERLRQKAEDNEDAALVEKTKAQASQKQAMDALRALTEASVIEKLLGSKPGLGSSEQAFLETALKQWQIFADEQGEDERARAVRAEGHRRMAYLWYRLGQSKVSYEAYKKAVALYERLRDDFPAEPDYRSGIAVVHLNLGNLYSDWAMASEAEASYRHALALWEQLAVNFPDVPSHRRWQAQCHYSLANLFDDLGAYPKAESAYREAIAIQDKLAGEFPEEPKYRWELATSQNNLGIVLSSLSKPAEAEAATRRALAILEKVVAEVPTDASYRNDLATIHSRLSTLLWGRNERSEAEKNAGQGLAIQEKLVAEFPGIPDYRKGLANFQRNWGIRLETLGKRPEAEAAYRKALSNGEKLTSESPGIPEFRFGLARSHFCLGNLLAGSGKLPEGLASLRQALSILEKLALEFPAVPSYRRLLTESQAKLGTLLTSLAKRPEAEAAHREMLTSLDMLVAEFPAAPIYREELARGYYELGNVLRKRPEAEAAFRQAIAVQEKLVAEYAAVLAYRDRLATLNNSLGIWLENMRKRPEAEAAYRQANAIQEKLILEHPKVTSYRTSLGGTLVNLGNLRKATGQFDQALDFYAKGIEKLEGVLREAKADATAHLFLRTAHQQRALARQDLQQYAEAAEDWRQLAELSPTSERPLYRIMRAQNLVRAGRIDEGLHEAEKSPADANAVTVYQTGCVFALLSDSRYSGSISAEDRQKHAGKAMEFLMRAVAKGYKDAEHRKKDDDLKALRERDDFKKLLADLEKKSR